MKRTVTMAMLEKELVISESAVSKALNDYPDIGPETKKLVREKAEKIGYTPNILARNLAKKTSNFVGVVIRDLASIYGEMFKSLSAAAAQYGLNLILYDTGNDRTTERECIRNLINTMAMGIVVVPVSEDIERIRRMTRGRVPVVYLGSKVRDDSVNYVSADGTAGTELAMQHLISQGHRKIVMLCDHKFSSSRSHKMEAYRTAMQAIGEEERILSSDDTQGDLLLGGRELVKKLLASGERFTALYAVKDMLAIGAAGALEEAGIDVPGNVSVVGYDGIDATALPQISLTCVSQPRAEMAEKVIDILRRHAEDPALPPEHYLAMPELIVRGSTAAAPMD